ncbi:MAG: hypothetical protein GXO65_00740 [Euryarchaeota archaeon]|nr:hypothetical protein [Euryarchaeota archaeon]
MEEYPAVISVVGGKGTRLYPLTLNITKSIIDITGPSSPGCWNPWPNRGAGSSSSPARAMTAPPS